MSSQTSRSLRLPRKFPHLFRYLFPRSAPCSNCYKTKSYTQANHSVARNVKFRRPGRMPSAAGAVPDFTRSTP